MARPQVADGGTASSMEGSCEYVEYAAAESGQGVVSSFGVGRGSNNSCRLKRILLRNIHRQSLGPGLIRTKQRKRNMRFGT